MSKTFDLTHLLVNISLKKMHFITKTLFFRLQGEQQNLIDGFIVY